MGKKPIYHTAAVEVESFKGSGCAGSEKTLPKMV